VLCGVDGPLTDCNRMVWLIQTSHIVHDMREE
jgi:hypothetical protein